MQKVFDPLQFALSAVSFLFFTLCELLWLTAEC